jgi:signal transduction histidine kinase
VDIFRPNLHAFGLRAFMDEARATIGTDKLASILQSYNVTASELEDPDAWLSLEFTEAFLDDLIKAAQDPQFLDRAARSSLSRKYLGPLYTLLRALGDVSSTYERVAKATPRFNKTGVFVVEEQSEGRCQLRFTPAPGCHEQTRHMCRNRRVQLATVPTMFDLAPAEVVETQCILEGDSSCVYDLKWKPARRRWDARIGGVLGLLAGMTLVYGAELQAVVAVVTVAVIATGAWAFGRVRELRQDVAARIQDLTDHQDALTQSMRAQEQRFVELLEAKAEVEQKVEQRTAELQQATHRLSQTLDEIQALDRAKTDFFNNVSHELRSPLTLILAPLEELVAGRKPPGGDHAAFEAMYRSAARLLRLINQLLDLAKIDAGEMKIAPAQTDLEALVRSTSSNFEAAAAKKGVALKIQVPANMRSVALDVGWIESAVTNLLTNALRLTDRGGAVRLTIEDHGSEVALAISDDGPGIALEDQKKVFERFAQSDATKRNMGGTGIGLALVREAARLHGGHIKLVSELGKGATFTLTLPRRFDRQTSAAPTEATALSHRPTRLIVDEFAEPAETTERDGPAPNAALALVVEDNPELREFIANVLAVRYRVRSASDGKKGVALARELNPDVIVSDVAMPEMDGYQLCRALRSYPETRATPILLVTARTEVASVLEGFEAGASDYILKPFHGRELLARVDVHVRLRRLMQEFAVRERQATLGVLAASVAHQVRNPLTTLVSGLPAMRAKLGNTVNQSTQQLMDVMIDCSERIERLTIDLMDLSRVDREVGGPYCPSDGLRAAIRLVQARLPETVAIEEQIMDAPVIDGRPGDMNHVFLNLLDNAARAVGDSGRIRIEAVAEASAYVIRVGDSGPGIDAETAKHVFEPFFTTRQAGHGTGLGLALAQQVVMQCGGDIELGWSELGGALFTVRIPFPLQPSLRASA